MQSEPLGSLARAAVFGQLEETGRAEQIAQRLRDAISLGLLQDGERLPSELRLAQRFGVASVTAREALETLRNEGLIRTVRGRGGGSFVTSSERDSTQLMRGRIRRASRAELRDLATVYGALAGHAAELASARASTEDLDHLAAIARSAESTDPAVRRRATMLFDVELAALSQSARLVREFITVHNEASLLFALRLNDPAEHAAIRSEHLAIIDALRARDSARVRVETLARIHASLAWALAAKSQSGGANHD